MQGLDAYNTNATELFRSYLCMGHASKVFLGKTSVKTFSEKINK